MYILIYKRSLGLPALSPGSFSLYFSAFFSESVSAFHQRNLTSQIDVQMILQYASYSHVFSSFV